VTLPDTRRIVVVNPKGGSGKTTLATNLAACYAVRGEAPALLDLDPQGSSSRWLAQRPPDRAAIHGIEAFRTPAGVTRSFAQRIPPHVRRVVVDTAAALDRYALADVTRGAHKVIVPVMPSDIDIHAATRTIRDLLLTARIPRHQARLAVVANRVRTNTRVFEALMRFLANLSIPVAAVIRDTQHYVHAAQAGVGIHELRGGRVAVDRAQWEPLLNWLEAEDDRAACGTGPREHAAARTGTA
jgi:chromosome partitioning protein